MMPKVMVVEDREETLSLMEKILTKTGFKFVGCLTGEECLQKYEKEKPDLILLDIALPGVDGCKVHEKIKSARPQQKIAFVSALSIGPQGVWKLLKFGMPTYISKSFDPDEPVNKVKGALKK